MDATQRTAFCPHCGNTAQQTVLFRHSYVGETYTMNGKRSEVGVPCEYFVVVCETCKDLLLYHAMAGDGISDNFQEGALQYPKTPKLHRSVPESVRDCYMEAAQIQNIAPNAYAVMLRRALEVLCDDREIEDGVLQVRLAALARRGEIPPVLAEMTAVLRVLGNAGAHSSAQNISVPLTWGMDDFFRAIVEYVYVEPRKLQDFKQRIERYNTHDKEKT